MTASETSTKTQTDDSPQENGATTETDNQAFVLSSEAGRGSLLRLGSDGFLHGLTCGERDSR